jgi:ribulose-5-phosphate 4-epimerase/fuculose-1-phosphate aldolase
MSKVVWNHITARLPSTDLILINRFGLRYDEITASNLLTIDLDGNVIDGSPDELNITGYVIHSAVHRARPDVVGVMHTHARGGRGVSALKCGLLPLSQEAMLFYEQLAYHDYEGLSDDEDERERLARNLGRMDQMVLQNHGLLTVGRTIAETFWRMFQLEMACAHQMDVLASGQEYIVPAPEVCRKARQQYLDDGPGRSEWPALLRQLDRLCPDYAS